MIKHLVLIRHAHRDTTERSRDNGLSAKGLKQARWLKRFAASRFTKDDFRELNGVVLSSPKARCTETVLPLAEHYGCELRILNDLDEQRSGESFAKFSQRMQKVMEWWLKEGPPLVILCSHGDWLPQAIFHVTGAAVEQKKGSWLEIEWLAGRGLLRWYIPSFKAFYGD